MGGRIIVFDATNSYSPHGSTTVSRCRYIFAGVDVLCAIFAPWAQLCVDYLYGRYDSIPDT